MINEQPTNQITLPITIQQVFIVWRDAVTYSGYFNLRGGDEFSLEYMETIGWLVGETPRAILIAQTVSKFKTGDILVIPKNAIEKATVNGREITDLDDFLTAAMVESVRAEP